MTDKEGLPMHQAVQQLAINDKTNEFRIEKLEKQLDEVKTSIKEQQERMESYTENALQSLEVQISRKMESIQSMNSSLYERTALRYEEDKQQLNELKKINNDMTSNIDAVYKKLNEISDIVSIIYGKTNGVETNQKSEIKQNEEEILLTNSTRTITPILENPLHQSTYILKPETKYLEPQAIPLNGVKHSIIVPPSSAAPSFYGKNTESPTQFLIRVQEYAESVHCWDKNTLINGISQFLRDSALEWYCQLRLSHRRPQTWAEFTDLFLAQFNSPVRKARQEREWHECKQGENETINEFLIRLRALWREQKPKEAESDLVKHLFCRMRNDLLNMIGITRNASLDEVIAEVQQIEEILYRRSKGERLSKQLKQTSHYHNEPPATKQNNEGYWHRATPWPNNGEINNSYNKRFGSYQVNEITPNYSNNNQYNTTMGSHDQTRSYNCFKCGKHGHWARDCRSSKRNYEKTRNNPYSKNITGALDERTSHAPL